MISAIVFIFAYLASNTQASTVYQTTSGLYRLGLKTPIYEGNVRGFGVSPAGDKVVFTPAVFDKNYGNIMLATLKEGSVKVEAIVEPGEEEGFWQEVRFAPNGKEVLGVVGGGIYGRDVYAIDVDGDNLRRLASVESDVHWPVVSTDGVLAYLDDPGNLWVVDPSAGFSVPRLLAPSGSYPEMEHSLSFSPNGDEVLVGTAKGESYGFDVTSGLLTKEWAPGIQWSEWETGTTVLSTNSAGQIERYTFNGNPFPSKVEPVAFVEKPTAVRVDQFFSEVTPPVAMPPDEEMLEQFVPRLRYDSQEPYFATDASSITSVIGFDPETEDISYLPYLHAEGGKVIGDPLFDFPEYAKEHGYTPKGVFNLSLETLGSYYSAGFTPPDPDGVAKEGDYIDEPNGTHMIDAYETQSSAAYGHIVGEGNGVWIQYWLFYYYNNGILGFGDHEGDWEMVQVHVSNETGLPHEVVFAQHSYASACAVEEYEQSNETYLGGGPVVYVANGSHASYPEEGSYTTEVPGNPDTIYPDEEEVPAVEPPVDNLDLAPSWVAWPGLWGGSGSSPRGPAMHTTQWNEPGAWASENAGPCTLLQESPSFRKGDSNGSSQQPPVELRAAYIRKGRVSVTYRASSLRPAKAGWPRLLLTVDSIHDKRPPRTITVTDVKNAGKAMFPFLVSQDKQWRVRASYLAPGTRSRVVTRSVTAFNRS